jgi:transcriptional regulator with XRE-family HTH domain
VQKTIHTVRHARLRSLLREIRKEAKLTQAELAARLDLPQAVVSNFERGERRLDLIELSEVCRALGIGLGDFVRRFEQAVEQEPAQID